MLWMDIPHESDLVLWQSRQRRLLDTAIAEYPDKPIPIALQKAFLACPRHRFLGPFRSWGESDVKDRDRGITPDLLDRIYTDTSLVLFGETDEEVVSTNSQPSYVLHLLSLLDLARGQNLLEIGSGSGWLAAMMAHVVGPTGRVTGVEIIEPLALRSRIALKNSRTRNVEIVSGDGCNGHSANAPYDRVIFSASVDEPPRFLLNQLRSGGLALVPLRTSKGTLDIIFLLKKKGNSFQIMHSLQGMFVPLITAPPQPAVG
jgi:protein-L-isoaspartate(D-aspartate) O-methyltransferase